ncbi:MAG: DUF4412 domain-containing protein [Kiritimatiellia bacterium]|nr:DUF4412 domain-containing protein [Kiritimatiellia bacterium]
MKYIALLFFSAGLAAAVLADMTVVQTLKSDLMPGAQQDATMTMTVKGQKARIDLPASQMSSIIDAKEGKMFTLIHKKKQVIVMSLADLKKSAALVGQGGQDKTKPVVKKTGKVDTIQGYKCAEYEFVGGGDNPAKIRCWITEDVDDSEMDVVHSFSGRMGGLFGFNDVQKPKGMIIRSESKMNIAGRDVISKSEVLSIKRGPVADSVFAIPADYQLMEMPAFNPNPAPQPTGVK